MPTKEMLINVSEGEECRIALLEDGRLEELYMERTSSTSHVGNIYKGRVTNVEPSIQAAFIDFGLGRNGFLHISDLMPTYFGRKGEDIQESVGRKMARRDRPPIQRCLRRGDELIVQIIKEGIGTKGPTLSTYISIPGRILVMMPGMGKFGVSRKIEDEEERRRLRTILDSLKPLKDVGFIIRTAGIGKTKTDIQRDLTYLTRLWQTIEKKMKSGPGPMELYTEGDLVTRTVRDVFSNDINRIVIDNKDVAKRVKEVIKLSNPRTKNKVELYEEPIPLFHKYGMEREIELMYSRHVPLPSGGSLVIDSTEAIVAIDVNSGKFRDHSDAEMTAFKTDMEAADEIPRQLRLRDLGGVIICDFIDLRYERHRRELEGKLHENLKNDRAKTKVLRMSQFGIIEMTRQRMRPSLKRSIYFDCPHCHGSGLVKTPESMSLDVMRRLSIAIHDPKVQRVELTVNPDVAFYLLNRKREQLSELEASVKKNVVIRHDVKLALDDLRLDLYDIRDGLVYLEELGMTPFGQDKEDPRRRHAQHGPPRRDRGGRGRGGQQNQQRDNRRGGGGRGRGPEPEPQHHDRDDEDRFDMDNVEDAVDRREETHEIGEEPIGAPPELVEPIAQENAPARSMRDDVDDEESDEPSQVIEVDEPSEPMGEGPREIEDDRNNRRNRGGQNRGNSRGQYQGQNRGQGGPNRGQQNRPPNAPVNRAPEPEQDRGPERAGENRGDEAGAGGPRRRRRRGRRGRGRGRNQQDANGVPMAGNAPQGSGEEHHDADDSNRPSEITHSSTSESYGGGEVETESIEATFNGDAATSADHEEDGSGPGNELHAQENRGDEEGPRRRRRRRGGRRHRRRGSGGGGQGNAELGNGQPNVREPAAADEIPEIDDNIGNVRDERDDLPPVPSRRSGSARSGPTRTPPPRTPPRTSSAPPPPPPTQVVPRTGSTDRHLMHEDAVDTTQAPEPPRRPRSVRDLDAIPDDFDE